MMKGEKSLVREDTSELGLTVSICDAYVFYLSLPGILVEPKNFQVLKNCLPALHSKQLRNLPAPLHFKCSDIKGLIIMVTKTNWIKSWLIQKMRKREKVRLLSYLMFLLQKLIRLICTIAWEYQARKLTSSLGISDESLLPRYPISMSSKSPDPSVGPTQLQGNEEAPPKSGEAVKGTGKSKRKSRGVNDLEDGVQKEQEEAKKSKTDTSFATNNVVEGQNIASETPVAAAQAQAAAFLGVLDAESLKFPTMPSKDEMAQVLLDVRKQALRDEYGVY